MHSFVLKIPTAQNYSFQVDTHSYYKNACYSLLPIGLGKLNITLLKTASQQTSGSQIMTSWQ
jgi:hypothetical protein